MAHRDTEDWCRPFCEGRFASHHLPDTRRSPGLRCFIVDITDSRKSMRLLKAITDVVLNESTPRLRGEAR